MSARFHLPRNHARAHAPKYKAFGACIPSEHAPTRLHFHFHLLSHHECDLLRQGIVSVQGSGTASVDSTGNKRCRYTAEGARSLAGAEQLAGCERGAFSHFEPLAQPSASSTGSSEDGGVERQLSHHSGSSAGAQLKMLQVRVLSAASCCFTSILVWTSASCAGGRRVRTAEESACAGSGRCAGYGAGSLLPMAAS